MLKFKSVLMAAVLAAGMSTAAFAQEQVDNGGFDGSLGDWQFSSPINLGASLFLNSGVVDTSLFSGPGAIFQVLSLEVGRYSFSFDGILNGNTGSSLLASIYSTTAGQLLLETFTGSSIAGAKSYEFDVATAGDYNLLFLGTARGGLIAVDNVSVAPAVAVPGPEAGAGLAGLAMAGMYVWASRRRKAQTVA